jgi:deazaflavin-dependent oxidoreductase (nitroreductase family)
VVVKVEDRIQAALRQDRVIDITTTGRASGQPRRKEIWFHNLDGRLYITGTPGKRDWYANLAAHPEFIFHLKQGTQADLKARATPITDPAARRPILQQILRNLGRSADLEIWMTESPLVEVGLEGIR